MSTVARGMKPSVYVPHSSSHTDIAFRQRILLDMTRRSKTRIANTLRSMDKSTHWISMTQPVKTNTVAIGTINPLGWYYAGYTHTKWSKQMRQVGLTPFAPVMFCVVEKGMDSSVSTL
jgi:hypothetical protein